MGFNLRFVAAWIALSGALVVGWRLLDPSRSVVSIALTVAVIQALVAGSLLLQRPKARRAGTWRQLRPGYLVWFGLVGCVPVSALLLLVYAKTNWSAYPHGDQSGAVLTMAVGFAIGAVLCAGSILSGSLRWNDERVQQRKASLRRAEIAWVDIVDTIPSMSAGTLTLLGRDGTMIRVPLDAHGLDDFLADVRRLSGSHGGRAGRNDGRSGITRTDRAQFES